MTSTEPKSFHPGVEAFVHVARPAVTSARYPEQRRYGVNENAAYDGFEDKRGVGVASVEVVRISGERAARMEVSIRYGMTRLGSIEMRLAPAALLELARCLVDAATDIEAEAAKVKPDQPAARANSAPAAINE